MKKIVSLLLVLVIATSLVACGGSGGGAGQLKIGRALFAAHGEKSFAATTVVLNGDKIALVNIDEYQALTKADVAPVPNSDGGFGEGFVDPTQALASKKLNNDYYSAMMVENAGSTQNLSVSWAAIENFAAGKTIKELETEVKAVPEEGSVDAIAGSTLVDNIGYLNSILEAAKLANASKGVKFEGDVAALKLGQVDYAAHGDKAFATTTVVVNADAVVLSYIDEYQFLGNDTTGVPNSDKAFGESFLEGTVLASKRVNDKYYSDMMKENASSTKTIVTSYTEIENYANGKTIAELEGIATGAPEAALDAVAGSTLADTAGYVASIVAAAKAA